MVLPLILTAAIVVDDNTVLRAAPEENAPRPAVLWRGDWLEVRGEVRGYLSVYDHRRERSGYVAPERVRRYPFDAASAEPIRAVIDFLGDARGSESLGIGMAALYLRLAPPEAIDAGVFEALGTFADRLARRASSEVGRDGALAEHLEVAASYGLAFRTIEQGGQTLTCFDGEAFRRALALGGTPDQRARAALALTDPRCAAAASPPAVDEAARAAWRAEVLESVDVAAARPLLAARVRIRRASASAAVAHHAARGRDLARAKTAFERALRELALVDRAELGADDRAALEEAAVRVGAERWAAEAPRAAPAGVKVVAGQPGQTCVEIERAGAGPWTHCTFGLVWSASLGAAPGGRLTIAVEPLPGWLELWIFSKAGDGWQVDTLVPAAAEPELGYVELAGWTPGGDRLLVVREARVAGALRREFQVVDAATLAIAKSARGPERLDAFRRFSSPDWKRATLALR